MAAVETIKASELQAWARRLAADLAAIDWRPAFKQVAVALAASTKENFFGSHTPEGVPWAALKRPRSGKRHRKATAHLPLRDTGKLMASVSGSAGGDNLREETPTSLTWGSNVQYAGFQNYGTQTIPARQFVGWNVALIEDVENILGDYAAKRAAGG